MHRIETRIEIRATPARVWSVLMDFPGYPGWNPFVRSIAGSPAVGASLTVVLQPQGGRGMQFRPTVLAVEPEREFRWKGKLLVEGLFDGEHYFVLEPASGASVALRHGEIFSGLLVPLLRRSLDGATKQGFVAMNEALKTRVEGAT